MFIDVFCSSFVCLSVCLFVCCFYGCFLCFASTFSWLPPSLLACLLACLAGCLVVCASGFLCALRLYLRGCICMFARVCVVWYVAWIAPICPESIAKGKTASLIAQPKLHEPTANLHEKSHRQTCTSQLARERSRSQTCTSQLARVDTKVKLVSYGGALGPNPLRENNTLLGGGGLRGRRAIRICARDPLRGLAWWLSAASKLERQERESSPQGALLRLRLEHRNFQVRK